MYSTKARYVPYNDSLLLTIYNPTPLSRQLFKQWYGMMTLNSNFSQCLQLHSSIQAIHTDYLYKYDTNSNFNSLLAYKNKLLYDANLTRISINHEKLIISIIIVYGY